MPENRIFLLSPARSSGKRADLVYNDAATFPLARQLRTAPGATIGETFSFLSGLYFRGKLAYARAFACPPRGIGGAMVITPSRGLVPVDARITVDDLREFARIDVDENNPAYREPFQRSAGEIHRLLPSPCQVVLLGSIATGKYVNVLTEVFGSRLHFPSEFIGRGDMSRGGLMLRQVDAGEELAYMPLVPGLRRRGARPPKLQRRRNPLSARANCH